MRRSPSGWCRVVFGLALLVLGAAASAQPASAPQASRGAGDDWVQARLGPTVALVGGTQVQGLQTTTYTGSTAANASIAGWGWLPSASWLGLAAALNFENLGFYDSGTRVSGGNLLSATIAPTARLRLGPLTAQASVGYGYLETPDATRLGLTVWDVVRISSVHAGGRATLTLGLVDVEASVALGFPVGNDLQAHPGGNIVNIHLGGGLRVSLVRGGQFDWGLLGSAGMRAVGLISPIAGDITFARYYGSLSVDLMLRPEPAPAPLPPPRLAPNVRVLVVDAATSEPLPRALVRTIGPAGLEGGVIVVWPEGTKAITGAKPGPLTLRAQLAGYLPVEVKVDVPWVGEVTARLALSKEPPKVGGLLVTVRDAVSKAPLSGATVKVGEQSLPTDAAGVARFASLTPGAVEVVVSADAHTAITEAAAVVAGVDSPSEFSLQPVAVRAPARVSGKVRSAKGGAPVLADVVVKEGALKVQTTPAGAFTLTLPAGTCTLTISASGFVTQTKSVALKEGEEAIYNVNLVPQ